MSVKKQNLMYWVVGSHKGDGIKRTRLVIVKAIKRAVPMELKIIPEE